MLSNLVSQLKEMNAEDKFEQVLEEVPRVRKDFGEPPLVTPSSQIVGTQAVLNVVTGERYKMCTKEAKALVAGEYGQSVKPVDPEVRKKVIGDQEPITCRPADLLENELGKIEKEMIQYKEQDEDVLTYALFPQVAMDFFKYRQAQKTKVDEKAADKKNAIIPFAGKMWKEAEIGEPYKQFLEKRGIRLYVSGETRWKEKKSRGGKVYRLAKAKAGLYTGGCLIPFFAEGLILEDGDSTTYTLFAGDQKSGAYFVPYVEKAAQEMK